MYILSEAVALVRGIEAGLVQIQGDIIEISHTEKLLLVYPCLVFSDLCCFTYSHEEKFRPDGGLAQLGERLPCTQ